MPVALTTDGGGDLFPLSVNGQRLYRADAQPFFLVGESAWSLAVQCTHAQIAAYLDSRAAQQTNALLVMAIVHLHSSQTPAYRNAQSAADPFGTMSPVDWTDPNETYWTTVDYLVNQAKARGIAVILFPAYAGYLGGSQGWTADLDAASDADLQTYGAWLANRYTQENVIWGMGGDYSGSTGQKNKQWNIVTGIRTVRTTDLVTAHGGRESRAAVVWSGFTGLSLNNIYVGTDNIADTDAAAAVGDGMPFILIEAGYENESGVTAADIRRASYTSILFGACGHVNGITPVWGFGEPNYNGGIGAAAVISGHLATDSALQRAHFAGLFTAYPWQLLVPTTDTSLVTSALGTAGTAARICPALASDGSFALVWVPTSQSVTVNMAALTPSSVRARLYEPATGTYSTVSGSPFANSGTQSIATGGERVIVLDAA